MSKKLNFSTLTRRVNSGDTKAQACNYFGVDLNRLQSVIDKSNQRDDFERKFASNEKKQRSKHKTATGVVAIEKTEIEILREEEAALSKEVMAVESDYYERKAKRLENCEKLRGLYEEIESWSEHLRKIREQTNEICLDSEVLRDEMNNLYGRYRELHAQLSAKRARIDELQTINICICDDGTISAVDDQPLDDSGFEEIKQELVDNSDFSEFKVREIVQIARLYCICKNATMRCLLTFDNEDVKTGYDLLVLSKEPVAATA